MHMFTHQHKDWVSAADDGAPDELDARVRQLLGVEHLVVLAGLGTSRCIVAPQPAPSMHDLWERTKAKVGKESWAARLEQVAWAEKFPDDIELLLSRSQIELELRPDPALAEFVRICEAEIVAACRFVGPTTKLAMHEAFLRRIARRPARLPRTQLYTTNYDLAFETAASRTGFSVIDGFSHAAPQRFDGGYFEVDFAIRDPQRAGNLLDWMPNVLQLLKLHGSVDWEQTEQGVLRRPEPQKPLIVYPRTAKFEASYQQPFLEFMARFQSALRRPDTGVLIVGSGLNDRHIVEPIMAAVRSNTRLSLLIVAPDLVSSENHHIKQLIDYAAHGDRRISLLAATFKDFTANLPDLVPETEAEQHEARTAI